MKFPEKYVIVEKVDPTHDSIKMELKQYDFDGLVDFMSGPTGIINADTNMVMPLTHKGDPALSETFIYINEKLVKISGDHKFVQVGTVRFNKNFHFQDFLDKNKDAKALIFYPCPDHPSIFHAGNHIRVAVIKDNNELMIPGKDLGEKEN